MMISKTLIQNAALSGRYTSPAAILRDVNDQLCANNKDDMFVTVWLGILTISTGELVSACAGHEYPVFYRREGGFALERDPHGLALGVIEGSRCRDMQWRLAPGDMLFLYTDGVPEANNERQEQFGNERMLAALEKSMRAEAPGRPDLKRFLHSLRAEIDAFAGETPQFDDITMLCIDYRGSSDAEQAAAPIQQKG